MTPQRIIEILNEEIEKDSRIVTDKDIESGVKLCLSRSAITAMQRAVEEVEKEKQQAEMKSSERFHENVKLKSELTTLRAELERLKQCEAIVREIAEDDNWLSGDYKCRQWVRDNPE